MGEIYVRSVQFRLLQRMPLFPAPKITHSILEPSHSVPHLHLADGDVRLTRCRGSEYHDISGEGPPGDGTKLEQECVIIQSTVGDDWLQESLPGPFPRGDEFFLG